MNDWKECKLGDIAKIDTGFAFKSKDYSESGDLKVVRGENVTVGRIRWGNDAKFWNLSTDGIRRYFLNEGDIVIGMDGSKIGENRSQIKNHDLPAILAQRVARLKARENSDQNFIWHLIFSNSFKNYIKSIHTGTSIPHISQSQIADFEILLPPISEQRAISSVLTSLNNKIDLLHRQNITIETIAETLFKRRFVENANGNTTSPLSKYADNVRINAKVEDLREYEHYVGLEHIPRRNIVLSDWAKTDSLASNKSVFEKGDILFGKLRSYFHKVVFAPINGVCSTDILVIRPKRKEWFSFCLFWFFNKDVVEHSDLGSGGTRMPRTSWELLSNYQVPKPDINQVVEFNAIIYPMIEKMTTNIHQIHTLNTLRDTILPKLMSGEVRVKI